MRARPSRALSAVVLGALVVLAALAGAAPSYAAQSTTLCRISDPRLAEISGITWSAKHAGVWWVHADSGNGPYIYALDGETCEVRARVRIGNIGARDLEAIGTGVDARGRKVLWLGDIGDNRDSWPEVRLHAILEPSRLVDQQVLATTYRFTYPDQPHNAESIIASPTSAQVWVVTKQLARGAVYRVPLSTSKVTTAVRVGQVGGLVTDAAMSPDGTRFVIRDYLAAKLFASPVDAASLRAGTPLVLPDQPQGEAVSFTRDGSALVVASENDDRLQLVPLVEPSASPPSSPGPTTAPDAAGSTDGSHPGRVALAVGALVLAAVGVVLAARRLRR